MHADELRQAVTTIVELLKGSDIRGVLDRYRAARGDDRPIAAARLRDTGATVMEGMQSLTPAQRQVVRLMHLDSLGTADYWQKLLDGSADPKAHQGDIVRLASRIMFAVGQLPAMVSLLDIAVDAGPAADSSLTAGSGSQLVIRLADAGEKASDPDRVARSIDGVDMLYSACASIARKPAMDLRMDRIDGAAHRDLHFSGEQDSLSAVIAVIESIPAALADIQPDGDIDLQAVVSSLPVFDDLETLASHGMFSARDLKDISETMQQGALLVLESGVVLVDQTAERSNGAAASDMPAGAHVSSVKTGTDAPPNESDEHYERYLREREAMQRPASNGIIDDRAEDRQDAVAELLRSLDQSRNGG